MKKYCIVGNGVAGTTAADHIRRHDPEGSITIIGDEALPFYNRIRLNDFIADEISEQQLVLKKPAWYKENRIRLITGSPVIDGDPEAKTMVAADGKTFQYDRLLLAVGSHSFVPPISGAQKTGVFTLRNIEDARAIKAHARDAGRIILIGGGLLGIETGNGLRKLGKEVMVVEFFPRLLPRQLDDEGAKRLRAMLEGMGFSFRLGAITREISGHERTEGVLLESGEHLDSRMVIVSAGVRANLDLARTLGLQCDKGIVVDDRLKTSRADIFAAGDAAEFGGPPYGIWPAGFQQGKIAGANMAGGDLSYNGTTPATTLKVAGIDLASAGNIDAEGRFESIVRSNASIYKKIVLDLGRIIGCILLGDTREWNAINRLMAEKQDVTAHKRDLLTL